MTTLKSNHLIKEKSPYLLQHAHNPVDWYAWGDEAFEKANKENKPIFLSIGYSTCHWCHVMEHESFESDEIADILNQHFVSIKVDREERPDIDQVYMMAVTALTGQGGWPLSIFLTPDKKPFWGGTYFPPYAKWGAPGFKDILLSIQNFWTTKQDEIIHSSQQIADALKAGRLPPPANISIISTEILEAAYQQYAQSFDREYGGFGQAPKFPMGHSLSFLLRYGLRARSAEPAVMVEKTLSAMANGGIYDHLGYGFHRYSTDREWLVPHFEKMLYDQAILARSYLEAYQATHNEEYARIAREIFEYVLRDMQDKDGGFYCAEDADSMDPESAVKKEGAFFLWKESEILDLLGPDDAQVFIFYYGVEKNGNAHNDPHGEFTGKNILFAAHTKEETAQHFKKSVTEVDAILVRSRKKMFTVRAQRPRPHLDDKVLVDWNGLMISSLAFGARVLNDSRYREASEKAARFILDRLLTPEGRLLHRYRDGEAGILGTLEDYAFFVNGLLDLYEATFEVVYLKNAVELSQKMIELFWDSTAGGFFMSATDGEQLFFRAKEAYDGAMPSGNSVAAFNLVRLYHLTLKDQWQSKLEDLLKSFSPEVSARPSSYPQMLAAVDFLIGPSREIILVGKKEDRTVQEVLENIYRQFLPNKVVALRPLQTKDTDEIFNLIPFLKEQKAIENKPTFYICENHICQLPLADVKKVKEVFEKY